MLNQDTIQRIQELQASGIKNKALTRDQTGPYIFK
ncbi:Uncharacterised protein [Sphingobacterium daejeonense]|nr:Uncharacterised protein [Sphingobacterium daejeonense]